jgi:hypothetical protein
MRKMLIVLLLAGGLASGCVSAEDKKLVSTGAAVGQGNLNEWEKLTPAKQKEAQTNLVAAFCILDHSVNERALPAWVASLVGTGR